MMNRLDEMFVTVKLIETDNEKLTDTIEKSVEAVLNSKLDSYKENAIKGDKDSIIKYNNLLNTMKREQLVIVQGIKNEYLRQTREI